MNAPPGLAEYRFPIVGATVKILTAFDHNRDAIFVSHSDAKRRLHVANKPVMNANLMIFLVRAVKDYYLFESLSDVGFICSDIPERDVYVGLPVDWSCAHWRIYTKSQPLKEEKHFVWIKNEKTD